MNGRLVSLIVLTIASSMVNRLWASTLTLVSTHVYLVSIFWYTANHVPFKYRCLCRIKDRIRHIGYLTCSENQVSGFQLDNAFSLAPTSHWIWSTTLLWDDWRIQFVPIAIFLTMFRFYLSILFISKWRISYQMIIYRSPQCWWLLMP